MAFKRSLFCKRLLFLSTIVFIFCFQSLSAQNCSVNSGIDMTICENTPFNLSGSSSGNVQDGPVWSQVSGPSVIIDDPSDVSSSVTGLLGGNTYVFRLSADCTDGSTQTQDVTVTVQPITIADAGENIASCPDSSGNLSVSGNPPGNPGENGTWSIEGANNAGVTINFPNSPTTTLDLPGDRAGVTTLRWTIRGPNYGPGQFCESFDEITITNYGGELPIDAGPDQSLDRCYTVTQSTRLNASYGGANINGQQGTWSFVSGPSTPTFSNANDNRSRVRNLIEGTYVLRWSVTGPCASGQDTVTIVVDEATQDITTAGVADNTIQFCDPSITTATLEGIPPQYSGETVEWTQTGGATASILNNTNSTTQVSGLSSSGGPYTFAYTITNAITGCDDTETVNVFYSTNPISITVNGGVDILADCGITEVDIPFTTTGNGSNSFSIISGPENSALVAPGVFSAINSNPVSIDFDVEGTYTVQLRRAVSGSIQTGCDVGTDVINITISRPPDGSNAGTPQILACNVTSTALVGNTPTVGTTLWSQLSGPSTATISDAYIANPTISDLVPGRYIFKYTVAGGLGCTPPAESTVSVEVSSDAPVVIDAGADQTVCYGTAVPLNAQAPPAPFLVGTWSVDATPVGATITFDDENDPNTLVRGLDDQNETYILRWTVANPNDITCPPPGTDIVTITTNSTSGPTASDAGPDQCLPQGTTTVTLAGNTPAADENGTWTAVPSTGISFADPNLFNTTASITIEQDYELTWTIAKTAPGCQSSFDTVAIAVGEPAVADAGPDQDACSDTFTMAATTSLGGSGVWSQLTGPGGVTINDETSTTATFTFSFSGQYTFEWTVSNGSCSSDSDTVDIIVGIPPTTASVGSDIVVCNATNTILSANNFNSAIETGFWSLLSGAPNTPNIVDVNNPNTEVNGLVTGSYTFRWTISGSPNCPTTFDDIVVDVFAPANAGSDLELCEVDNFLLEATFGSTGTWSQQSTTGPNAIITQNPSNSNVAEVSITPGNTYVFRFTTDYPGCPNLFDEVTVTSSTKPSVDPDAGPDQILCQPELTPTNTTTLTGNAPPLDVDTATWRFADVPSGSVAVIDNPTNNTTTLSGLSVPGIYILEWNFSVGNCSDTADVVRIEVFEAPSTADAGTDQPDACQLDITMDAVAPSVGIGTWSFANAADDPSGGDVVIDSPNSPTTTLSNITTLGTYRLTWTVSNGTTFTAGACAPSVDTVDVTFTDVPPTEPEAGPNQEFCDATQTNLDADSLTDGTGTWTQTSGPGVTASGNAANITAPTNPKSLVLDLEPGIYEFTWTAENGGCTLTDTMQVEIISQPVTSEAGPDQTLQQFATLTLDADTPVVGQGTWTQVSGPTTANFVDANNPDTEVFGIDVGTYEFEWTVSNDICSEVSDTMVVTVVGQADLELTKTVNPSDVNVGDTVTFTISLFNNDANGQSDATGVSVRDVLPNGYSVVLGSVSNDGVYNPGNLTITWENLMVTNAATLNLTFDATINESGSYENVAEIIASDTFDPDSIVANGVGSEDDQDTASISIQSADLSLAKTVNPAQASVGETVTFTMTVTNDGTADATGVTISDLVPLGYSIVTINDAGSQSGNALTWAGLSVGASSSSSVSFTATVNAPTATTGEYINTAEITASDQQDPDSTPDNDDGDQSEDDEDSAAITLEDIDLELNKGLSATSGNVGDRITITVNLANNDAVATGNGTGITVVETLPNGFDIVGGTISNGGVFNPGDLTITWSGLSVANGADLDLSYDVTINSNGNYTSISEIIASDLPDIDSTPDNGIVVEDDYDTATFAIQSADLSLAKTVSPTQASVGETVTFTLAISNAGTADATNVSVQDLVPTGYTIGTVNDSGTRNGNTLTWAGLSVGASSNTSVSFTATVNAPTGTTGEYANAAEITASDQQDPDSTPGNDDGDQNEDDEDSAAITLEDIDLELNKGLSATSGNVGDRITVMVNLANNDAVATGNGTGITVVETLPNGFDIVGGTISNGGVFNPGDLTITWSGLSVANGADLDLSYDATINSNGNYTSISEIIASDLPDIDSTPNNDDGDQSEDDEDAVSVIIQSADLSLVKDIGPTSSATPNIGDTVVFELTVTNAGPSSATNVRIEDFVPRGYTLTTINNGGSAIANTLLSWDIPSIPVGTTVVSYEVTVNEPSGDSDEYLNTAEITESDQNDPDSEPFNDDGDQSEDDEDFYEITPQVTDLELMITASDSNPNVGDIVTFSIQVSNTGDTAADGVAIRDIVPPGFGNVASISNGGSLSGNAVDWSGLSVPLGINTLTLTFTAEVLPPTGTGNDYGHTAQVIAANQFDIDSNPNNDNGDQSEDDEDAVSVTIQTADLSLVKTSNSTSPNVGETVIFTLTITNSSTDVASGVSVTDVLPTGFTLNTVNNGGTALGNTASWSGLSVLGNGGSISLSYEATVNAPTGAANEYLNAAQITASDQYDPDSDPSTGITVDEDGNGEGDDDDEDRLNLTPAIGDLSLTKIVVDNDINPNVGSEISFEVTVFNDGPNEAQNVEVADLLPNGFDFVLYSATSGIYNEATGLWRVGDVRSGESETLVIDVLVNASGDYTNVAEVVRSDVFDSDSTPNNAIASEDDQDQVIVTPTDFIDVSLEKIVNDPNPDVDDTITFTLTISNAGPSDATNVQVLDQLPSGFAYLGDTASGAYDNTTGIWNIGTLSNGATNSIDITVQVNTSGDYLNKAEVISHNELDADSTPNNNIQAEDDQSEVAVSPRNLVDISVTKIASTLTPNIGENIVFTVTVTNDGPSDATSIVVTDLLESGYTFVSATASTGSYEPLNGSWTIGNLPNGTTETIVITANVLTTGTYTNTAELTDVAEFDIDSEAANNDATEDDQATVNPTPLLVSDLSLQKVVNNATPDVGETIEFTIDLTNDGPNDARGVTVTDLIPSGYTYVSHNATSGSYDETTGIWNLNRIVFNATTETLNILVTVNPTGDYNNVAELTASDNNDPDSTPSNALISEDDMAEQGTVPVPIADLSLTKTVDNEFPDVSENVTFSLTLINEGPSEATGVVVTDLLENGYNYISDDGGGTYDPTTGLWNVGSLASGVTTVLNITVGINAVGSYANTAELTSVNELDPDSAPNNGVASEDDQASQSTQPRVITDISVTKTVDNPNPSVGAQILFTVTVTNDGPSDATGVIIEDIIASGYTFLSATTSAGSYTESIGSWNVGNLANGATETLDITVTVLPNGNYANIAELIALNTFDPDSSPDNNLNSEDDQDTVTPSPTGLADLSLTKEVDITTPNVGDIVEFTLNIRNAGDSDATGVEVTDQLPEGFAYVSHVTTIGIYDEQTGIWRTNGIIPDGTTETLIILARVNAPTGMEEAYLNRAVISKSDQTDPDSDPLSGIDTDDYSDGLDDDDETSVLVVPQMVDIAIEKRVNTPNPSIGDAIVFTITVLNQSDTQATNIGIEELLPTGYRYGSHNTSQGSYDAIEGFWSLDMLEPQSSETLEITATVLEQEDYRNTATLAFVDQWDTNADNDSSSVTIDPGCLHVFNEFSPNGDGVNDVFKIVCISRFPNNVLRVYNRWGNIVFEQRSYDNTWGGISNGRATITGNKKLPVGTYYYVLDLGDGSEPRQDWLYINR